MKGADLKTRRAERKSLQEDSVGMLIIVLVVAMSGCFTVATFAAVQVHKDSLEELYDRVVALEDALIRERLDRLSGQASDLGCE